MSKGKRNTSKKTREKRRKRQKIQKQKSNTKRVESK